MKREMGDIMNDILVNFVSGRNRPIERRRQLLGVECGGYGMMDMNVMNTCVKSTWIRRVKDMEREGLDYIGVTIGSIGGACYDQIGGCVDTRRGGIICMDILTKWFEYKREYYKASNNIMEAHIFKNKGIMEGDNTLENLMFTVARYRDLRGSIRGLTLRMVLDGQHRVKSKREIELLFESDITWVEYFRLRTNVQQCVDGRRDNGEVGKNGSVLMSRGKIKSSKLRKRISGSDSEIYLENDPRTMSSLRTLWGIRIEEKERRFVELNLRMWTISVLDPEFKDFCFRLLHGRLYLNLAISHFSDIAPGCTFCTIKKGRELRGRGIEIGTAQYDMEIVQVAPETAEHLFWACREVKGVIKNYINMLAGSVGEEISVIKYWEGCELEYNVDSMLSILVVRFVQFATYRCRVRRRLPLLVNIRDDVGALLEQINRRAKWRGGLQRLHLICQQILE